MIVIPQLDQVQQVIRLRAAEREEIQARIKAMRDVIDDVTLWHQYGEILRPILADQFVAAIALWQLLTTVPIGGVKLLPPFFFSTPLDVAEIFIGELPGI